MTTIDVIISKGDPEPILTPDYSAILSSQLIAWQVCSGNPDIKKIRVEFDDPEAKFFPNTSHPTWVEHDLTANGGGKYPGQCLIWGEAPDYKDADKLPREDKYTVKCLDAEGNLVTEIDPYIITTKPRPKV